MAKKQKETKQPPPPLPPKPKSKKQEKQSPPSLGPLLSNTSLAKSEAIGAKQQDKPPPPLPDSSFASSSNGEESPPPASSRLKKPSGTSTSAVLRKHSEPSSDTMDGGVEEEEESSESDHESKEEESSDNSTAVDAKPNPPPLPQTSREGRGKQTSSSTSRSGSSSEDGEDDDEEVDSSSESDEPPSAPPHKQAGNIAMKAEVPVAENVSDSSSDSHQANPTPRRSSISTAAPLSSKPVDCPAQPVDNSRIIATIPSSSSGSKKKRKRANEIKKEVGQEKKNPFQRIWCDEDEICLLRGVLDYKERHHVVPSSLVHLEALYDSIKGLISIPVTLNQMFAKVRRIRQNYIKRSKKMKESAWARTLNAHNTAIFDLSMKIWDEKLRGDVKNVKGKGKHVGFPSLHRFINYEHTNSQSVLRLSHISSAKSNKLEEKCEKLEITEIRLHVKKQELFSAALELIDAALAKC